MFRATIMTALLMAAVITPAAATPAEDAYLAARDAAIAKIKAATDAEPKNPTAADEDKVLALNTAELAKLDKQLRAIVGPIAIEELDGKSAINLDSLFEGDEGFGVLDGMVFGAVDAKTRVIVTTDGLFRHWLAEHKDWWGKDSPPLPQDPSEVIKDNDFYTQAVMTDSAIIHFADLPIRGPMDAAFSYAMLASRTQDEVPAKADEIFIALEHEGRVFLANTKDFRPIGPIAACDTVRKRTADTAQRSGTNKDGPDAASTAADAAFLNCFAEKAPQEAAFAAAAKAAQALIDRLPLR